MTQYGHTMEANKVTLTQEPRDFKPTQILVHVERWKRIKARAAIEGKPVYRVVDEALAAFLGESIS